MSQQTPLRGAVIGCGFVSQHHLDAWKQATDAEIVAVCDLHADRLANALARIPTARPYRDASELFTAERLDFVEICTGPEAHRSLTELAARHQAHVLCQKPSAPQRADLLAMIAACEAAGVRLMIHENWRFRPWYRTLREEIARGKIGRPLRLRLSHLDTRALRPDGFQDQPFFSSMPRLILFEMGPHLIDSARFLMGEVVAVTAQTHRFGTGHVGEDVATLLLEFASGAVGLLDLSWCARPDLARAEWALNQTVVEGSTGCLKLLEDGSLLHIDLNGTPRPISVPLPPAHEVYLDAYRQVQAHFLSAIRQNLPMESDGVDNLATMDVIWAGYDSAAAGKRILLSPRDEG